MTINPQNIPRGETTMARSFNHEATTLIEFPTDRQYAAFRDELEDRYSALMVTRQYAAFRDELEDRYSALMVTVNRERTTVEGRTTAAVRHSRNLGAEIKGLAYGYFDGNSINTIYHGE
jgi:hypothetical protein